MKVEIVSHCWNYGRLLTYQLSSLVLHLPERASVTMTVFYAEEDARTRRVLDFFARIEAKNVTWRWWSLDRPQLIRRAIGRNLAALATEADWVWFSDCDICFGQGALDTLAGLSDADGPLVYPPTVLMHKDSRLGDLAVDAVREPQVIGLNPDDFVPVPINRAIGGVQIVRGDYARQAGYCQSTHHLRPNQQRWRATTSDVTFRKIAGTDGKAVEIPNIYRIWHSQSGHLVEALVL